MGHGDVGGFIPFPPFPRSPARTTERVGQSKGRVLHDIGNRDMIRPSRRSQRRIGRRVDAGERAELVGEVRLVVEAAIERQLRPWNFHAGMKALDRALEALDAAPHLGRKSHLFAKDLRESALAPARTARDLAHRRGREREQSGRGQTRSRQVARGRGARASRRIAPAGISPAIAGAREGLRLRGDGRASGRPSSPIDLRAPSCDC